MRQRYTNVLQVVRPVDSLIEQKRCLGRIDLQLATVSLGLHLSGDLPMALASITKSGQDQTVTATATGLACFIFRFLKRPH